MPKALAGILFALSAAALNGSIGIISKLLMASGLNPYEIAFYKTFLAFVFVSLLLIRTPFARQIQIVAPVSDNNIKIWMHIGLCALFGIFTLFFFETIAYGHGSAANVVVILMASATIAALVFGCLLLNEKIKISAVSGVAVAIAGISVISWSGQASLLLLIFASAAGAGYGLFSVLVKKFGLHGGIYLTRFLLLFGLIYLAIPYLATFRQNPFDFHWQTVTGLIALVILPTILGFYCTTKALGYLSAAQVQVTELAEPIFAMLMGWLILSELPDYAFFLGALLIITGIMLINDVLGLLETYFFKRTKISKR